MTIKNLAQFFELTSTLPYVGEKGFAALTRLGCVRVIDLLLHLPYEVTSKEFYPDLAAVANKSQVVVKLEIREIEESFTRSRKKITRILGVEGKNFVYLTYFNHAPYYIISKLVIGNQYIVSGKIERIDRGEYQIVHPEIHLHDKNLREIEPKYPLTYAITSKQISSLIRYSLSRISELPEWLEPEILKRHHFVSWNESLIAVHNPKSNNDLFVESRYVKRLAFDELLASQLALKLIRMNKESYSKGSVINPNHQYRESVLTKLGFELTEGQAAVLDEIERDQASKARMMRLLQGDVGSGKTLVALLAMLNVVAAGKQAVLMVPTDILANQHYETITRSLAELGIEVALLTGSTKKTERTRILAGLMQNKIQILIGTHALFQKTVEFQALQLVVIDEQHRFGVEQRLSLMDKGKNCDALVMSATPIPRTLALTAYGDMDISILKGKPQGKLPIQTMTASLSRISEVTASIKRKIDKNEQVFWVCPMSEVALEDAEGNQVESEAGELAAVMDRYQDLASQFSSELVGLIHGKLSSAEKDAVMADFASGKTKILVATTVIEVGIDIPQATLLIVENAERFGLAQLHQLRGRVGRGAGKSECILLFGKIVSEAGRERLKTMRESEDGFYIAEQDLKLRGGGDILGSKQSGLPEFRLANLDYHQDLLLEAHRLAERILSQDSKLRSEEHQNLRLLLSLFDYDQHLNFIFAG